MNTNTNIPSENILKLRKLTEKIDKQKKTDDYESIVKQLKEIVDEGKSVIEQSKTEKTKIKCYETMCATITNLLTNVKFI